MLVTFYSLCSRNFYKINRLKVNHFSNLTRNKHFLEFVSNTLSTINTCSSNDWKQLRENILQNESNRGQFTMENIDAVILNYCVNNNTDMGLSYIDFMSKQNIQKNLATFGKYMQLLFLKNKNLLLEGKKCSQAEESHILQCYNSLRKEYAILDSSTLEACILALSVTSYWKKGLEILKEIEITSVPNYKCYSALIAAAFLNGEHQLAWRLLEDTLSKERIPTSLPFITFINSIKHSDEIKSMLENLFYFFQDNDFICNEDIIPHLTDLLNILNLQGMRVNVSRHVYTYIYWVWEIYS